LYVQKKCHNKWLKEYSLSKIVNERLKKQGTNSMLNQKKTNTLPEIIVREYLIKKKITFIEQYSINEILIADFYLPKYNCILEVYGDYWHSNPKYYGDKENLKPLNKMQKKIKNKDIRRYKVLVNKLKYNFYSLWEDDIKNRLSQ
jgi:G:T-mismatch repair DNA endonuclease (very short patch repair protein)